MNKEYWSQYVLKAQHKQKWFGEIYSFTLGDFAIIYCQ